MIGYGSLPGRATRHSALTTIARGVGILSLAVGVAVLARPRQFARALGVFEQPVEVLYAFAVRDLLLGALLVSGREPQTWLRVRGSFDIADGVLAAVYAPIGRPPLARTLTGVLVGAGSGVLEWLVTNRLAADPLVRP